MADMSNIAARGSALLTVLTLMSGCTAINAASLALDLVSGTNASTSAFRNPMDRPPGQGLQEALGRVDGSVSQQCLDRLAEVRGAMARRAADEGDERDVDDGYAGGAAPVPQGGPILAASRAGGDTPSGNATCRTKWVCLGGAHSPSPVMMCKAPGSLTEEAGVTESAAAGANAPGGLAAGGTSGPRFMN